MDDVALAISIACRVHSGQFDKGGNPYILHPVRIMMKFTDPQAMVVGVLHDAVEDGDVTLEELALAGFSDEVVKAIDCLSKREGESYDAFISRIEGNDLALRVKVEDLRDNMNLARLPTIEDSDLSRVAKYHAALRRLLQGK